VQREKANLIKKKKEGIMKYFKYLLGFALSLLVIEIVSANDAQRNLSTPLSRLVGHWKRDTIRNHFYFGPLNLDTGTGSFIHVYPLRFGETGFRTEYGKYKLVTQDPSDKSITIIIIRRDDENENETTYFIEKNGSKMFGARPDGTIVDDLVLLYVDSKTSPEDIK